MSGFYLKKFELFNWGTFDSKVETFFLNDDINIISGSNGSGKTTVVDALVSLLVPNNQRKYNLSASDSGKKKARNEETYVRGAYKNSETGEGIKTVFFKVKSKRCFNLFSYFSLF
ncbi:MAG: ATP-binding protein [Candidatus Gracilibacteria bacterium]|nr:ATP-binding protein [Candidatus Gracilibacteria bacterium]